MVARSERGKKVVAQVKLVKFLEARGKKRNNLNIKIDNQTQELIKYNILCNLIQDIIKQEILVYKNNSINEIYKNIVTKIELPEDIYTELHFLFNQNIEINLSLTNIDLNLINEIDDFYNMNIIIDESQLNKKNENNINEINF